MDQLTISSHVDFVESPYFTLPDRNLLDDTDTLPSTTRSIKTIYCKVELMTDRKQADFLLRLMAHSDIKPNFEAMATSLGLPSEAAVQVTFRPGGTLETDESPHRKQRFKSLCEMNKFKFENSKVEAPDAVPDFDTPMQATAAGYVQVDQDVKPEPPDPSKSKRKRTNKRKDKPASAEVDDGKVNRFL